MAQRRPIRAVRHFGMLGGADGPNVMGRFAVHIMAEMCGQIARAAFLPAELRGIAMVSVTISHNSLGDR